MTSPSLQTKKKDYFGTRFSFETPDGPAWMYRLDALDVPGYTLDRLPYSIGSCLKLYFAAVMDLALPLKMLNN